MPEVKFTNVVTFSSEDPVFKAENLLNSSSKVKKWRTLTEGESQLTAVLQMEKPIQISTIDIGNDGSAFVEIQVGRKGSIEQDGDFHVLLGAASFLSPIESRNEQNLSRVRMFNADKFNAKVAKQNWDQIKIICTQPFNKHMKYGISFIKVHSVELNSPIKMLGAFALKDEEEDSLMSPVVKQDYHVECYVIEVSVGALFASRFKTNSEKKSSESLSVAASIKSESTLASIVLSQEESSRKRKLLMDNGGSAGTSSQNSGNGFYQLKKDDSKRRRKNDEGDSPLPRRDILPGEKEKRPKFDDKTSKIGDKKSKVDEKTPKRDDSEASSAKKKIKVVDRPKIDLPKPDMFKPKPIRAPLTKPFNRLLEGVFFVLSGFQNPLRGQIRDLGLQLGAKYRADWDSSCTHLICAFSNTPKFREVKSLAGKIVKKEWLEECHRDRKKYPWRRFCLDPRDKGEDSEDEVWAIDLLPSSSAAFTGEEAEKIKKKQAEKQDENFELDTDEELEMIKRKQAEKHDENFELDTDEELEMIKKKQAEKQEDNFEPDTDEEIKKISKESKKQVKPKEDTYELDTDEEDGKVRKEKFQDIEEVDSDEAYGAETDVDNDDDKCAESFPVERENRKEDGKDKKEREKIKEDTKSEHKVTNGSSKFFTGKSFLFYGPFDKNERQQLTSSIRAAGGTVQQYLKTGQPDFVITRETWDRNFDRAKDKNAKIKFVFPEYVEECLNTCAVVSTSNFEVK